MSGIHDPKRVATWIAAMNELIESFDDAGKAATLCTAQLDALKEIAKQAHDQFCPACGAGFEMATGLVTLPMGFPFDQPCDECERRGMVRAEAFGAKMVYEREKRVMEAVFGVPSSMIEPDAEADTPVVVG